MSGRVDFAGRAVARQEIRSSGVIIMGGVVCLVPVIFAGMLSFVLKSWSYLIECALLIRIQNGQADP